MTVRPLARFAASLAFAACLATSAFAQAPGEATSPFDVTVANRARSTLMYLYLAPTAAPQWGEDRLGNQVVERDRTKVLRIAAGPCRLDVRALYDDGSEETRFDVDLCGGSELALTGAGGAPLPTRDGVVLFGVRNATPREVLTLHVVPAGSAERGEDLLATGPLASGASITGRAARPDDCRFDILAGYQGATRETERQAGVDLCARADIELAGPAAADPSQPLEVSIANGGRDTLYILFLRPAGSGDWGPDRFGTDVVPPGRTFQVRLERSAGCIYDVRMIYESRREEQRDGLDLCATPTLTFTGPPGAPAAQAPSGTFDVNVVNRSGITLYAVFVRAQGAGSWSRDLLGSSVVPNGRSQRLRINRRAGCVFDVRLVFTDRTEQTVAGRDLCAQPELAIAAPDPGQQLQVSIANRSPQVLFAMFLRRSGTHDWGQDRFGSDVVPIGQSYRVRIDRRAGCEYDVRMVYADRTEETRTRQDLCTARELVYTGPAPNARGRGRSKESTDSQETPTQVSEITIVNRSPMAIENFHASSSRVAEWLADRLTDGAIQPGAERRFQIERDGQCVFDMRVTYAGGREERRMRVNICTITRFVFMGPDERLVDGGGPPDGRLVTIVNAGPIELRELFMTSVEDTHWGEDRLGASVLPRRWRVELRLPNEDGCRFDVRAVFRSGAAVERRNVDVCAEATIRFEQRHSPGALVSTGTGFYVSAQGHILTNHHVIDGCSVIALFRPGAPPITLRRIAEDEQADLALLVQEGVRAEPLAFRPAAQPMRAGERVVVIGYPVRQELGGVNVTEGLLSALRGQRGDARRFQYSAPTQPGNSGGPVFDETGAVIGVVVSQLDGLGGERSAQNINFGISLSEVRRFLEANGVPLVAREPGAPQRPADLLERVGPSVLPLDCIG